MDNSNIIISVIIVLCIAAGVTAYGISEGDDAVFSDLTGFSPASTGSGDTGIGNATTNGSDGTGVSTASTNVASNGGSGSSSGGSSGGSGSGTGSGSGSGSSGGSSTGSGGGSSNNGNQNPTPTTNEITADQAKSIASGYIEVEGAYVGNVERSASGYICRIYDANGNLVDAILIGFDGSNLGKV
ncbi:MAG: endoglucanase [Methanobrevibacter sp.]|nr:endoglucanase [Methanobrevibacter sp.]